MGLELDMALNTHKDKTREGQRHVPMMSQRTTEGGTGIYIRGFLGIMREAQLGITLSLPVINEEEE